MHATNTAFPPLPTSTQAFPQRHATIEYVKTPSFSGDTSAEWAHPTALDFETHTIHAQNVRVSHILPADIPLPPDHIVESLHALWHQIRDGLTHSDTTLDTRTPQAVTLSYGHSTNTVHLTFTGKTWPRIPGVTTHKPDTTR